MVERVDANPRLKARLGAYYFTWAAIRTFTRRYLFRPPRMRWRTRTARQLEGVTDDRAERLALHLLPRPPDRDRRGRDARLGRAGGVRAAPRHAAVDALDRLRAFSRGARVARHRQVTGLSELTELTVRSADGRPLPLQVDGDYIGEVTEARYSILPRALNVVS